MLPVFSWRAKDDDVPGGYDAPTMAQPHLPFPTQRAFVVQIHADVVVAQGQVWGRVEHLVSGQATRFQSMEELVRFMKQVLSEAEEDTLPW
jgi:hypothetical protein